MRRLTAILLLFALLCPLAAMAESTLPTGLAGRWETSTDETLCATVLYLMYNGQYRLISEGVTTEGMAQLDGDTLTLESSDGYAMTCTWDHTPANPTEATLTFGDGLHLYRCIELQRFSFAQSFSFAQEGYTGHFDLMLLNDNRFMLDYYFIGGVHPDLPEGGVIMRIGDTDYWEIFGTWLRYEDSMLLTSASGDVWVMPLDPETGLPADADGYRFMPAE